MELMEEDDDEVVLKNSALYSHLLENGLNDFESAEIPKLDNYNTPPDVPEKNELDSHDIYENAAGLDKFTDIILNSNLVFHDDIIIIKNFTSVYQKPYSVIKSSYFKLICQTSATSSISLLCSFRAFKFKPLICVSLSLTPLGFYTVKRLHQMYVEYKDKTCINEMIKNMKDLSMMVHKCVKFIQESEVLTYYSVNESKIKSSFGISSGNNNCRGQIMFQLRRAVYDTLQSIIFNLKTTICSLVKNFPIKKSAENMNFYLAFLNEQELCCAKNHKETITVDELQKMKYIYLLLQSEFLKRLCLNMNPSLCVNRINKDKLLHLVETVSVNYAQLHSQIKDVFHIFYILEKPDERKTTTNADWIYKEAYVKICSVSQNLQTLLRKSRHIEEYLENTRIQNNDHDNVISTLDAFSEELVEHYERSKSVIDDFYNYVLRQKPKTSNDINPTSISTTEETKDIHRIAVPVGKSDFNPSCPDEVFIGVSSQEKKTEEENADEDYTVSKKCSKLLISELKLALKDKAQEWKERERVALQSKNLVDEEESESDEEDVSSCDELDDLKINKKEFFELDSESSENELSTNVNLPMNGFPMGATFAEKIAFASSKWGLKSEEFVDDSEDDVSQESDS
ncbi:vezatin-like [Planococcus citri]|uniref:vezatin-like n=1 Tax=Planococcus citri TaxID=170843 RepID=UPI0031F9CF84